MDESVFQRRATGIEIRIVRGAGLLNGVAVVVSEYRAGSSPIIAEATRMIINKRTTPPPPGNWRDWYDVARYQCCRRTTETEDGYPR
jgi:hypothetical protein